MELISDGAYGNVTEETKGILRNMDQSNQRLIKLVDEFLDITRIEQGRTKFDYEEVDMGDLINSVGEELKQRALDKQLKLEWQKPDHKVTVMADSEKIRHVVFNFADNAIKYSPQGTINISLNEEKGGIAVRVLDQGFGFGEKDQHNFFQKFYRGDNVKKTEVSGTGLGLYVCRKFIENHKGQIWAKSPGLGQGSEFGFWIPLKNIQ
jgi:signal transduction histidine kinase